MKNLKIIGNWLDYYMGLSDKKPKSNVHKAYVNLERKLKKFEENRL